MVATEPRFLFFARRIFIDIYLTAFMVLALACLMYAYARPACRRWALWAMYVCLGLGVLTKGPVAIVLPALVGVAWLVADRRIADLKRMSLVSGAVILLAIVVPWYAALYAQHGWTHIRSFLLEENLGRFTTALMPNQRGPFFYVGVLLGECFPWTLLLGLGMGAGVAAWRRTDEGQRAEGRGQRAEGKGQRTEAPEAFLRLLGLWVMLIVVAFSFSRTKEDLYIYSVVPAVAVLIADRLVALYRGRSPLLAWLLAGTALLSLLVATGVWWLFGPASDHAMPGAVTVSALLAVGGIAAMLTALRRRLAASVVVTAATFVCVNATLVWTCLPAFERYKPVVPMSAVIRARATDRAVIVHYKTVLPSMVYYLDRPIVDTVRNIPQLVELAASTPELFIVMKPDEYDDFRARVSTPTCVLDRRTMFADKLLAIVARKPWPELWLVGSRDACRSGATRP
jgi:4-amino-4-deoxy-L-arabinose transferase-like glycosyltransferase